MAIRPHPSGGPAGTFDRAPDWSKSPPHQTDILIGGKRRKLNELQPVQSRTYGKNRRELKKEVLDLIKDAAYTVREIATQLSIMHVSAHGVLMKLMDENLVGRAFDPEGKKMYYTVLDNFPEDRKEKAVRRYQTG